MRTSLTQPTSYFRLLSWWGQLAVCAAAAVASPVRAQAVVPDSTPPKAASVALPRIRGILNSRAEIENQAIAAERIAASADLSETARKEAREESALLRERLAEGDYRVGDRMVITINADTVVLDTFVVRSGTTLTLPSIPEVSLKGVLRSEVDAYLTTQYARYVKNPSVKVTSLVRLAVLGSVGKPGFYAFPSDLLVSDVIMLAGGPSGSSDLDKTVVKRGKDNLVRPARMRTALRDGLTLDQLDIRSGDELVIESKKSKSIESRLRVVTLLAGLVVSIYGASRIFSR